MSKAILTTEPISGNQIADWKEKHKNVFQISVPNEDSTEELHGYFRKPTIDELALATGGNKDNPLKASLVIYNSCLLGGHPAFAEDESVKMAAMSKFGTLMKVREAEIKKL